MPEPKKTTNNPTPPPIAEIVQQKKSFMGDWYLQYYRYITVFVCLIIFILGYFFIIFPKFGVAKNVNNIILIDAKTKQTALKKRIEYLTNLENRRKQMPSDDLARIDEILPSEPGVPEIFASIQGIGIESGAIIESIQLAKVVPTISNKEEISSVPVISLPAGVSALEINITVSSTDYNSVKTLLTNIEKSLRLMDIIGLTYDPSAKSYNLIIRSYYLEY